MWVCFATSYTPIQSVLVSGIVKKLDNTALPGEESQRDFAMEDLKEAGQRGHFVRQEERKATEDIYLRSEGNTN